MVKVVSRYVTRGAIGGALVSLDVRDLYLKDISLLGCTRKCFPTLLHTSKEEKSNLWLQNSFRWRKLLKRKWNSTRRNTHRENSSK